MGEVKNLAQHNETMFERNIAIRASKEEEVLVITDSNDYAYYGFVCGLDDEWMQICGYNGSLELNSDGDPMELILLNKDKIVSIIPTGRGTSYLDDSTRETVRKKIHTFSTVSKTFLDKKK